MASITNQQCGICQSLSKAIPASKWCNDCDEALCINCNIHHAVSKATKNHKVADIKIPQFVLHLDQKLKCSVHQTPYELFCGSHKSPCCISCLKTNHETCTGFESIDERIKREIPAIANLLDDLTERLKTIETFYEKLYAEKEMNMKEIKESYQKYVEDIKTVRIKVNKVLEKLEKDLLNKLEAIANTHETSIKQLCLEIETNKKRTAELLQGVLTLKNHGYNTHAFIGKNEIQEKVSKEVTNVEDFIKKKNLNCNKIILTIDTKVQEITSDLRVFGEIKNSVFSSAVPCLIKKQAQTPVFDKQKLILTKVQTVPFEKSQNVEGCAIMPNGKFVCLYIPHYASTDKDQNDGELVHFNNNGSINSSIKVSSWCFDVACITDTRVAVTSTKHPNIIIVSLEYKRVQKIIPTENICYGITYFNHRLYSYGNNEVQIRSLYKDEVKKVIIQKHGSTGLGDYDFIAVGENRIYLTRCHDTISCYDIKGSFLWKWINPSLKFIRGITLDNNANLLAIGRDSNSIVVLSPDGKQLCEILEPENMAYPRAIDFDQMNQKLLICDEKGGAKFFSIAYKR
ncbi:uncharacterized protein LOC143065180 [Mytilus galloprovincialis]|uniref:uncharacterized protein LOC143065180 n=1 Tax=Mytilus galloprovincialis TaxID=29158 RepID=UPI003F7BB5E8